MRVSIEISEAERLRFQQHFKNYGTVQPLLNSTGMHRATLSKLLKHGKATKDIVEKVRNYVNTHDNNTT